jgi:hypothetical protein
MEERRDRRHRMSEVAGPQMFRNRRDSSDILMGLFRNDIWEVES